MPAATSAPGEDEAPTPCALCRIDGPGTELVLTGVPVVVTYVTDDLVAVAAGDDSWVLVASRSHRDRLPSEPREAGVLLSALRRAATEVAGARGGRGYQVDPVSDVPEAPGHVCYRVEATARTVQGASTIDVAGLTIALARSGPTVGPADRPRRTPFPG